MRGDVYDVFISYSRSDEAGAAEVNGWLRAQGLSTFYDRSELRPGLRWIPGLEDAIDRSRAVVILFGKHGIGNTQHYERELALVRQTRESTFPVIPVLMPGCASPPTGFLQLLTWVDLSKGATVFQQPDSLDALRSALHGEAIASSELRSLICPYRGLEPFREEDAPFFCGREDTIGELVAQVRANSFVAVVGPSGSGKSSLVFAGLLPALRQERQTRTWDVVSLRPGAWPLRALAAAFGSAPQNAGPAEIDAYLENEAGFYRAGDAETLARIVNDRLDAVPEHERLDRLLIYVDQWEELYAMAPPAEDKNSVQKHAGDVEKFMALLVAASANARATVVLTVRADFYNPLIRNSLLSALLPRQQVNIMPMRSEDLRSTIETPAKKAGLSFAPPELVDQILSDVGTQEGRLPLLQFAVKETWERRERNRLTAEAYTAVGGVTGAIEKTAEAAYERLTAVQKDAARRLFLRLVTPGQGQEDTRARSVIPEDPQQREVIKLFSDPKIRLLVTGLAPLQGAGQAASDDRSTVEVAHEALIQRWPMLQAWVNANREKLRARTAILRAKAEWGEKGEVDDYLLPLGVQLERGRALLKDPSDVPIDDVRDFVDRSIKRDDDRLAAQRQKELADQKRIVEVERQAKEAAEEAANKLQIQLDRANQALAASINSDLGFEPDKPFKTRERIALWKLAYADEPVKRDFVSILAGSPEETLRTSPGFAQIWRALGLLRPSSAEAEDLVISVLRACQMTDAVINTKPIVAELEALAAKLTDAQASQALDLLLTQIGGTTDPDALQALAKALQALAAKLTEARASQTLDLLLTQIGRTTDPRALWALAQALQALAAKLSEAQASQALDLLLTQIGGTTDPDALEVLVQALQALPAELTEAQASQALAPALTIIDRTTDSKALQALALALQTLSAKLTEAQASQALAPVIKQIGRTTDEYYVLRALAKALEALPAKLSEAQASQALAPVLTQITQTRDPRDPLGSQALRAQAEALQALAAKLTDAQASQALAPVLKQFGRTTDPRALQALAQALQALAAKLTGAQASQALARVLKQIGRTTDPDALQALAEVLRALAAKLTDAQASQALAPVLKQIGRTTDRHALQALAEALPALAAKLSEAQASQALAPVLKQFGRPLSSCPWLLCGRTLYKQQGSFDPHARALALALRALAAKLTEAQASQALDPVLKQFGRTTDLHALQELAQALQALPAKLSQAQASQALDLLLTQIGRTTDLHALWALALALRALAAKLSQAQASQALDLLLTQIGRTTHPHPLALAEALQALAAELTEAQASQALDLLLTQIDRTTYPHVLQVLAQALRALPAKLTEAQASQALAPVLTQIGRTTDRHALQELAQALQALAANLTEAQAAHASKAAAASLAWAADDKEAAEWARALVTLSRSAANRDGMLVNAIAYPAAAGSATEVLLDAIRAGHPDDAPRKQAGTVAALAWLAKIYPDVLRPPLCPQPLQPGLKCPPSARE